MKEWCLEIWGENACFTRPEMKVERVSYDVITPSAARAIFESILWKPAIKWHITKIEVLNPIKWMSIRRNEVAKVVPTPTQKQMSGETVEAMGVFIEYERQQRAGLILKDVRYRIYGYFEFISLDEDDRTGESPAKYAAMFERRASKGQCFHRPYLGCREFSCDFRLIDESAIQSIKPIPVTKDLGYMLYDLDFDRDLKSPPALFYRAKMVDGTIITDKSKVEVRG